MKKANLIKLFILFFILVFAGFCFAPCIEVEYVQTINLNDLLEPTVKTIGYETFAPAFCCSVSAVEIILLMFKNNNLRLAGLAVNLIKTFATYPAIKFVLEAYELAGGFGENRYILSVFGYITIGIGCIISALYVSVFVKGYLEKTENKSII